MRASPKYSIAKDVQVGEGTEIYDHVNLYKCKIGRNCKIEPYVYIEGGVVIGDNCKISRLSSFLRALRLRMTSS